MTSTLGRGGVLVLFVAATASTACTSTFGPVVSDVRYAPDGTLVVERCDVELIYAPFKYVPDGSLQNCRAGPPGRSLVGMTPR